MNKIHIYTTPELFPTFCYMGSMVKYNRSFDYAQKHYFDSHADMIRRAAIINKQLEKPDQKRIEVEKTFRQRILNKLNILK